jgi:protein TonB
VGGDVQAGLLLHQVRPSYPPLAKAGHVTGVVKLAAIITCDGRVRDLTVISGHPLLVKAALEAVRQWLYKPTLLNGEPIEVKTVISLNFQLAYG